MKISAFLPMTPQGVRVLEYLIKVLGSFMQGILRRLGLIMYFAFFLKSGNPGSHLQLSIFLGSRIGMLLSESWR